ncbi:MAG: peptide-methionine (S)-S-oxide reductase, partial [Rhodobacteraceae bacterium]|nr:peptide-methionine (S)-S-oxide reductase [Paracoccaceae bacterium]
METAVFAGGCFWGMEDLIRRIPGVHKTRVGYTGGHVDNPTYRLVCTKTTGHAEAVEIEFDPSVVSYRKLLEFFFQIHDPTTIDRQGNDIGDSYRSEIFYTSDAQKEMAVKTIEDVNASGLWPAPVVTKASPAVTFWEAEPEHQERYYGTRGGKLYTIQNASAVAMNVITAAESLGLATCWVSSFDEDLL